MSRWQTYTPGGDRGHVPAAPLRVLPALASPQLGSSRDILVCLPPDYDAAGPPLPVVYMQDGQNLFDPATSFAEAWRADEVVRQAAGLGLRFLLVGIPNGGPGRLDEYSPFRDPEKRGGGRGEAYLDFVIDTVKPEIDAAFRTRPDPAATAIAGSSMGGLISLYAAFRRPDVFGLAGALSPALWFARRALFTWLAARPEVGGPRAARIYLDAGTGEGPVVMADVARLRDLLIDRGYRPGRDVECVIETGGRHDETSWGRRLLGAIRFMLAGTGPAAPQP